MKKAICKKCGVLKRFDAFDKILGDGPLEKWNLRKCKECTHKEYKERYSNPDRRQTLLEASSNWKKVNADRHAELAKEYRARYPEKTMAQNRLNYAVRKGRIKRMPCEICGETENVQAHHVSYDPKDWYNVHWLCITCHKIEHG